MKLFTHGGDSPFVTIIQQVGSHKRFEVESKMDIFPARVCVGGVDIMAGAVEVVDDDFGGLRVYPIRRGKK
jgi:hypothetical protein